MPRPSSLPKEASALVLNALNRSRSPLSAYQILERLKKYGVSSPPIVYRALDKLVKQGKAHKIEHLNAYLACGHSHRHDISIISVCSSCHDVSELHEKKIEDHMEKLESFGLKLAQHAVIELPVTCDNCAAV